MLNEENTNAPGGQHILVEFWGVKNPNDLTIVEQAMRLGAKNVGTSIINIIAHNFSAGGLTVFALLKGGHLSIHTWPEINFAAIDILMPSQWHADTAIIPLFEVFQPTKITTEKIVRGGLA